MDFVKWLLADRPALPLWLTPDGVHKTADDLLRDAAAVAVSCRALDAGAVIAVSSRTAWETLVGVLGVMSAGRAAMPTRDRDVRRLTERGVAAIWTPDRLHRSAGRWVAAPAPTRLILETSGSSGRPRQVMLGEAGIRANIAAIRASLPMTAGQRIGCLTPLHYSYGLIGQCMTTIRAGGQLVSLTPGPWIARQIEQMHAAAVSGFSAVPSLLHALIAADVALPALTWLGSAGAHLSASLVARIAARLPNARLFNQYGMTEASPRLCAGEVDPRTYTAGWVGAPLAGISITIRDADGAHLPAGQLGEIVADTPSAMLGYWQDPAASAQILTAHGLKTGDIGALNARGELTLTGRRDDLVQIGGERVSLVGVEEALLKIPGVRACAVRGRPDPIFGHRIQAFVVAPGLNESGLRRALRHALPPAARPQEIAFLPALPTRASGKINRVALDRIGAALQSAV